MAIKSAVNSIISTVDQEKQSLDNSTTEDLQRYVVPTLPKGVKNALTQPAGRWTKFRIWYNTYRQLFTLTFSANMIALLLTSLGHFHYGDKNASSIALGNILVAVLVRNELFLRGLFWVLVQLFQKWSPFWFRIFLTAFLQHLGGVHSGAATSGVVWLIYAVLRIFQDHRSNHLVLLAMGAIVVLFISTSAISALPVIRERHHNVFEHHHRFAGWLGLLSTWTFVMLTIGQVKVETEDAIRWHFQGSVLLHSQQFWFTLFVTILIFAPWFTVRKVPVEVTTPSPRVAIVKFDRGIQQGLLGRVSRDGLREYHAFGIISEGIESGCHYMIVGAQGDWTRRLVNDPPKYLYTREMKFAGLPYLAHLYKRGIMICTGSGIGAVLSTCLQLDNWFLIWIGSGFEETFGGLLLDMISRKIPPSRRILFDTKKEGRRPDTVKMLNGIYTSFSAEVVIITSNPQGNAELMQACKESNMNSFGPLWDS